MSTADGAGRVVVTRRLHGELGMIPPVEFQAQFKTTASSSEATAA